MCSLNGKTNVRNTDKSSDTLRFRGRYSYRHLWHVIDNRQDNKVFYLIICSLWFTMGIYSYHMWHLCLFSAGNWILYIKKYIMKMFLSSHFWQFEIPNKKGKFSEDTLIQWMQLIEKKWDTDNGADASL